MPGPGGGRGGGGSFGGGGGFRGGGGFGGGHHGGFHRGPRFGFFPFFWGGGLLSILLFPFILILLAAVLIFTTLAGAFGAIAGGGQMVYNEEWFQDFANAQYEQIFAEEGYEDNILLVVLTTEDNTDGYFIAWVGDHVSTGINLMFGAEQTELGRAVNASISGTNYKYQLDSGIAMVLDIMAGHVQGLGTASPFKCTESHPAPTDPFRNYTALPLTPATVKDAITDFTDRTGINIAVVVEEAEDIFETDYTAMIMGIIMAVLLIGLAVFLIVKGIKANRASKREKASYHNNGPRNFYSDYYRD